MNEFTLYTFTGDALFDIVPEASSSHEWVLMSENRLSLTFELEQCVNLSPGCYIDFDGVRYYLLEEYKPQMVNTTAWKYNVNLFDAASWMSVTLALNLLDGQNTPIFNYTAPAVEHAQIIVANLNRRMGTTAWKVGRVIETGNITIEYRGKYCSDVLQEIVDGQNTEWWLDDMTLNIGRAEFGDTVELGYQNGLLGDIVCEQADNMRAYAYLCPIGSTRNIDPTKYGFERLQLPNGQTLVPMNPEQGIGELAEEKAFSKIFPRYEGTVKSVRSRPAKGNDGREFTIYYIGVALPFNPNDYEIAGLVKQITFLSGQLIGEDFEANYDSEAREFEIITRWPDGGDAQLPGGLLTPEVGDKYVIWNITMPDVYYTLASQEFLEAAEAFAAEAIKDVGVYKAPLDYVEVQERGLRLRPGQRVRLLSDAYFSSGYYDSRITRITRDVLFPDAPRIEVSAVRATGTISRIQTSIQKTEAQVARLSGALPTVVKSGEDTTASDSSVYTSAKSEREFLNRRKGGAVLAPVDFIAAPRFPAGADFNGAIAKFDAERKCWIFPHNLLVEGGIAWNTKLEGFEEQTITAAVQVDWKTIGKNENGELYVIGGTSGGGGGVVGGVTLDEVKNYLSAEKYTTETWVSSQNYATQSWVTNKGYITGITSSMVTSALGYTPLDSANFTKSKIKSTLGISDWALANVKPSYKFSEITNTPTTLSGYGITDAYSKTQVDSALAKKWTRDDSLIANWDSAYSWGNHALAGYIKGIDSQMVIDALGYTPFNASDVTEEFKKYVTLSTDQTVTGIKDFLNGFKVGGALVTYNASKNAFVFPANAIFEGGIAWNSKLDGFSVPTIMDAIKVDGSTISKANGYLEFIGKTGGGTADSVAWGNITGKPTTLSGYGITDAYTQAQANAKFVDFTTDNQQITGVKNFVNGAKIGGKLVSYNADKNAFVIPANVVIEGGVAWNSSIDGFKPQTILDAIPVDEVYISKKNGYLEFIGKAGGGVADSVAWSNVTGRPTKLSQFTDDVVSGNYLPIKGIAEGAKTLKGLATSSSWIVAAGNGFNVYNNSSTKRCWFGFSLPEGSPYATTKWVFGASDSSYNAAGEIYAKHISLGYGDSTTTGGYALRANGDAKIDGTLTLNGKIISYNASKNAFVLPANVIIEGGVAWNSKIDGFDIPTIMDAVVVDGDTIVKENGKLKINGDVSGGINESQLGDYLTRNNYAKKSDIPSLSGYATESFVTTRGYITASAIPTKVSAFTNDASYATESFVTSRGYITSAAISKANIKSILGISDWALATASPLANHGKITSTTDLATLATGLGYTQVYTPVEGAYDYGQILNFKTYRGHTQIYVASKCRSIHIRNEWNPTGIENNAWLEILTSNTYTKYAMSLTTDQRVTGIKNFVNGFKVGDNLITYDASLKSFVLNGNLIVKGGIAWEKQNS